MNKQVDLNANSGDNYTNVQPNNDQQQQPQQHQTVQPLKLDAQEFYDISEDDYVDFDTSEEYLLHFSRIGHVQLVRKLLHLRDTKEIVLNIDCKGTAKSNYGWSPLHLATYFGHYDVVEILIKNGADINVQNEEGDTPLHKAAYTGRENIVILLLANNANVFIPNGDSLRAFEMAKSDSIRNLLSAAEKFDIKRREEMFLSAARSGKISTMKELLEDINNGVDINCVDSSGNTALHCAAYRGQTEAVIFLLKNGIDTSIKNKRGQIASNVAATISLKQLIQEAHLSIITPKVVASLKNKSITRFEGCLLRKVKFFGWRPIWAVLERGVFSYFQNRADASTGVRRKGYKYLENAITEIVSDNAMMMNNNNSNNFQNPSISTITSSNNDVNDQKNLQPSSSSLCFMIIFCDRSRAMFALPKNQTELDLQKWINSINDHIYFSTTFMKQGTHLGDDSDDDDDEEQAKQLLSPIAIQDMISTTAAHQKILERHINALKQLLNDETLFQSTAKSSENDRDEHCSNDSWNHHSSLLQSIDSIPRSTIPSIKFHLNLILESSKNANSSLSQCLILLSHKNQSQQTLIRQEQEKVRALDEALQLLAREHHDLQTSVTRSIKNSTIREQKRQQSEMNSNNSMMTDQSMINDSMNLLSLNRSSMIHRSLACLSQSSLTTATDMDEYFDAFDDDVDDHNVIDGDNNDHHQEQIGPCKLMMDDPSSNHQITSYHTANTEQQRQQQQRKELNDNDLMTINDSISTLSPDNDNDRTLGSDDDLNDDNDSPLNHCPQSLILHALNDKHDDDDASKDANNVNEHNNNSDNSNVSIRNTSQNRQHRNSKHRDRLPAPMVPRDEIGLWSILKHCIGKELSKITFPVIFNEPLSFLQRITELFYYTDYLNIADQCDDVVECMENICAFIVSAFSSNWLRLSKPFNPLLNETFEYEIESSKTRILCEQISHHPPISAWHAESPNFIIRGTSEPKLRFWGKSIQIKSEGTVTLELKTRNEVYTWKSVNCYVHNVIVGKIWFEQYGTVEVTNHKNNYKLLINFKPAGWFGYDLNRFDGYIQNEHKEKLRFIYGKWNDYLKSANISDYESYLKANNNRFIVPDKPIMITENNDDGYGCENLNNNNQNNNNKNNSQNNRNKIMSKLNSLTKHLTGSLDLGGSGGGSGVGGGINDNHHHHHNQNYNYDLSEGIEGEMPKSDSSHSLDIQNSRIIWKAEPKPENSALYYNFNSFTFGLNELPEDSNERLEFLRRLPPTDTRLRPDIRKLEEGDLDAAAAEKNRLEEKQRESKRLQRKGKIKQFRPLWFRPVINKYTGQEDWIFTDEYWTKRDWSKCPDIF